VKEAMAGPAACWGVFREAEHSPGRQADDAAILEAAGRRLERAAERFAVSYRAPDSLTGEENSLPALAFAMCEGRPALEALQRWEARGVCVVNSARAVINTHREKTIPLLEGLAIPMPETRLLEAGRPLPRGAEEDRLYGACWVKQATEHKTREGDVVFATDPAAVEEALERLRGMGLPRAIAQRHVEGDLLKFYGVTAPEPEGPGEDVTSAAWFQWFYHREHPVAGHAFDPRALHNIADRSARALGLDVWGGDAIVTAEGSIYVIDVNAWPSFALFREEAADHIAAHLTARLRRLARVAV
jgi:glutathione synthase/RimK-type ligase-like ATP-grasp enzyme